MDRFVEPDPDALSLLNQRVKLFREAARLRSVIPVASGQSAESAQPRPFRKLADHSDERSERLSR